MKRSSKFFLDKERVSPNKRVKTSRRRIEKWKARDKTIAKYHRRLSCLLGGGLPLINSAKVAIELLKEEGLLIDFMKKTDYFVFNWAVENDNAELLNHLWEFVRPEHHFLMVSCNDFTPIKSFVIKMLHRNVFTVPEWESHQNIVEKMLSVLDDKAFGEIKDWFDEFVVGQNDGELNDDVVDALQRVFERDILEKPIQSLGKVSFC